MGSDTDISDNTIPDLSIKEGLFVSILSMTVLEVFCVLVGFVMIGVKFNEMFVFRNCSDLLFSVPMSMLKSPQIKQSSGPTVSSTS